MATQTILSTGTTFVSSLLADTNLSASAIIIAGTDPTFADCISFLKFTIPSLSVASVDSAILKLFVFSKSGVTPSPVVVNRVTSAFDTATVTYNTMPSYVATASTVNVTASDVLQYVEIDVTILVNQWLSETYVNYGIALTNTDGTTAVQFGGKDIGASYEPQLVLSYGEGAATFGYVYNPTDTETAIELGSDIIFQNNGSISGITHIPGTTEIIVPETGNYLIEYTVVFTSITDASISLAVNGTVVSSTLVPTQSALGEFSDSAILTLEAGDSVTLRIE